MKVQQQEQNGDRERVAVPLPNQSSGVLSALSQAHALAEVVQGDVIAAGEPVIVYPCAQFLW